MEYCSVDESVYTFDNVKNYIQFVLASVHIRAGETDSSTLSKLEECYGNGMASMEFTRVMYVLKKTNNSDGRT